MPTDTRLQFFESIHIRTLWDEAAEKWWFSALDVVAALTEQTDYAKARNYWKWLKTKLKQEGSEVVSDTNLLNSIEGIVIRERKKKKVKLFEKMPTCPLCKDVEKRVFYFEPDDIWVCRVCHNEFKYKYEGIEEY